MKMIMKRICAALVCAVILGTMLPLSASALSEGVYTAGVVTSYYNPDTGEVDDGGTANAALGEGMCRSATAKTALVESDGTNTWVTVRLLLQSNCKNVALYTRNGYNSYSKVNYTVMQENAGEDSIDYRFKVSDAGVMMKGTMYVTPMGRDVVWYLYVDTGTLAKGSGDFVVSVDTSAPVSSSSGSSSGSPAASRSSSGGRTAAAPAASADASPADGKASAAGSEADSGDTDDVDSEDADGITDAENGEENGLTEQEDPAAAEEESAADDRSADHSRRTSASARNSGDDGGISGAAVTVLVIAVVAAAGGGAAVLIRRKRR